LSVGLPADYKALVEHYGWGEFCDFLYTLTPFGESTFNGLRWQNSGPPPAAASLDPKMFPYPLHPAPGGLLIWGGSPDSDRLCWLTDGPPDAWRVVVWSRDDEYETHDTGAARFIEGWVRGTIDSPLLGCHELNVPPWFTPCRLLEHVYVRLTDGDLPYGERLRILRNVLAPTEDRGAVQSSSDGSRQDHFAAVRTGWRLTYETAYGHQIRVAFPPGDNDSARQLILSAVKLMGCQVLSARTVQGTPVWEPLLEPGSSHPAR
jgi:hypothetical protein